MPDQPVTPQRSYLPVRDQAMPRYRYPSSQENDTLTVRNSADAVGGGRLSVLVNGSVAY